TAQFHALAGGKTVGVELQDERQRRAATAQQQVAQQAIRLVAAIDLQQRQLHLAAFGGTDQRTAQFIEQLRVRGFAQLDGLGGFWLAGGLARTACKQGYECERN